MPETADGAAEVHLELAGAVAAVRVVSDRPSAEAAIEHFRGVAKADMARYCRTCGATMAECRLCGERWCLDHQLNPMVCPGCGKRPRDGS
jgi:hypothetical protein